MSKFRKIKKKLSQFVNQLTPDQVREQLVLAYLQMERCKQVLRGADVEPVAMLDNGECSDLELFYLCKKLREELDLNNQNEKKPKGESITIGVDFDCSDAIKHLKDFKKSIDSFRSRLPRIKSRKLTDGFVMKVDLSNFYKPIRFDTSSPESMLAFHKDVAEMIGKVDHLPKKHNHPVYFMYHGRIHKNKCAQWIGVSEGKKLICKIDGYDGVFPVSDIYQTPDEVVMNVGKIISTHVSFSKDHQCAYFIDQTNRVFKGATWYLNEQGIENFETLDDLRQYLLQNIIEDGKRE